MHRLLIILFLVFFGSTISQDDVFTNLQIFPTLRTTDCAFPFTYNGNKYTNCTIDGDNGDIPWCSLTKDYQGIITYCYDFRSTTLKCLPSFTMPDGRTYTGCARLSAAAKYEQCKTNNDKYKYMYCIPSSTSATAGSVYLGDKCNPVYKALTPYHTMCYRSPYANEVPLTAAEQTAVLDMHNKFRAGVSSRYMFKLYWDDELAKLAQAHANLCAFEHDLAENRQSTVYKWYNGQNIVMSTETTSTPASLISKMLTSEKPNFRYGQTCSPGENMCLHYTQAMISNLTRVGCGQSHCVFPDRIERYLTCNYIQSQYEDNYNIPYVPSDTAGVDCKTKVGGLCDCGNKICSYNDRQYLNPKTCECVSTNGKRSIENVDVDKRHLRKYKVDDTNKRSVGSVDLDKRGLRKTGLRGVSERSIDDDPNAAELAKYEPQDVVIRPGNDGTIALHRRHLRKIKLDAPEK